MQRNPKIYQILELLVQLYIFFGPLIWCLGILQKISWKCLDVQSVWVDNVLCGHFKWQPAQSGVCMVFSSMFFEGIPYHPSAIKPFVLCYTTGVTHNFLRMYMKRAILEGNKFKHLIDSTTDILWTKVGEETQRLKSCKRWWVREASYLLDHREGGGVSFRQHH